ncbi:MAG: hypothetical protein ACR2FX_08970 [Chthoniobacterales bacterium]
MQANIVNREDTVSSGEALQPSSGLRQLFQCPHNLAPEFLHYLVTVKQQTRGN